MTELSIIQKDILESANARGNGAVLPFPGDMKIKGGAVNKVLASLASKGLIEQRGEDYIITNLGRESIGADIIEAEFIDMVKIQEKVGNPSNPVISDKLPKGKLGSMLTLLKREKGATITELMEATAWQKHSVRGAMSGQLNKKYGLKAEKIATRNEETVYHINY